MATVEVKNESVNNSPPKKNNKKPRKRRIGPPLAPAIESGLLLVRLEASKVGMFRFLLEAYEHLAYFSVLNRQEALLKIVFSPHRERAVREALAEIHESVALQIIPWPYSAQFKTSA